MNEMKRIEEGGEFICGCDEWVVMWCGNDVETCGVEHYRVKGVEVIFKGGVDSWSGKGCGSCGGTGSTVSPLKAKLELWNGTGISLGAK